MSIAEVRVGELYKTRSGYLVRILAVNNSARSKLFDYAVGWLINPKTGERSAHRCARSGESDPSGPCGEDIVDRAFDSFDVETFAVVATGLGKYPQGFILNLTDQPEKTSQSPLFNDSPGHWTVVKLTGKA